MFLQSAGQIGREADIQSGILQALEDINAEREGEGHNSSLSVMGHTRGSAPCSRVSRCAHDTLRGYAT